MPPEGLQRQGFGGRSYSSIRDIEFQIKVSRDRSWQSHHVLMGRP